MTGFAEYISKALLARLADEETYREGRHFFLADRVKIVQSTDDFVQARVFGNGIHLTQAKIDQQKQRIAFSCDCVSEENRICKHGVGLGLAIEARTTTADGDDGAPRGRNGGAAPTGLNLSPVRRRANVRRLKSWESFLQRIEDPSAGQDISWVAVFFLETKPGYWNLHARKAHVKKNGVLGRTGKLTHADVANRAARMREEERLIVNYIGTRQEPSGRSGGYVHHTSLKHRFFEYGEHCGHLISLLEGSRIFLDNERGSFARPITVSDTRGRVAFVTEKDGQKIRCQPLLYWNGKEEKISDKHHFLTSHPVWLLREDTLIELEAPIDPGVILPFQDEAFALSVEKTEFPEFLERVQATSPEFAHNLRIGNEVKVEEIEAELEPRLYLQENGGRLEMELRFAYDDFEFDDFARQDFSFQARGRRDGVFLVKRRADAEREFGELVLQSGAKRVEHPVYYVREQDTIDWLLDRTRELRDAGFTIYGEETLERMKIRRVAPRISIDVRSQIDWFDVKLLVDFDGIEVSLKALKKALRQGKSYVKLADGSFARLPEEWVSNLAHLFQFAQGSQEEMRFSKAHATLIDLLTDDADVVDFDPEYREFVEKLKRFERIAPQPVPKGLKGTLRPYQQAGYEWMCFLKEYGFSGCLADDMGLGKTIQALCILLREKETDGLPPSLIVAPTSVIFNWEREAARFAPALRLKTHAGIERERSTEQFAGHDVILTSYGLLRRDIGFLKEHKFNYVILDESQNIKNPASQTAKAARLLKAAHRVVLTGTPVENNTLEMWSQFAFLNPGMLGSQAYFQKSFVNPIENRNDQAAAAFLQKLVFPFILRRTKEQVEKDLPPKTESIFYANMEPDQEKLYTYWRDYYRAAILNEIDNHGLNSGKFALLEGLMKLRQIACHPMLVDTAERASGKYDALKESLTEIIAEGHKVLVFSQFVRMLSMIRTFLDGAGIQYEYLDGSTRDREARVESFQGNPDIRVFLVSLRAGGTGLNLTAADYVLHYDPWWNPAVEMQATDRSHRIGQDKHVFVYKFITKGTVEEKVLQLQERKQKLVDTLISTDRAFIKSLSREDIESLFA